MNNKEGIAREPDSPQTLRLPEGFEAPTHFKTAHFVFEPLSPAFAEADYEAVAKSIDIIRETRGGDLDGWPDPAITFAENRADLERHWQQFKNKEAFAYAAFAPTGEYIGCFYLYPPGHRHVSSQNADVDVNFWVTAPAYEQGMYTLLYKDIRGFLEEEWPFFKNSVFTNKDIPAGA